MKITGTRTALQVEPDLADAKQIVETRNVRKGTAYLSKYFDCDEEVKGKLILWPNTEVSVRTDNGYKVTYSATTQANGGKRMVSETINNGGVCNLVNMSESCYAVVHFTRVKIEE